MPRKNKQRKYLRVNHHNRAKPFAEGRELTPLRNWPRMLTMRKSNHKRGSRRASSACAPCRHLRALALIKLRRKRPTFNGTFLKD